MPNILKTITLVRNNRTNKYYWRQVLYEFLNFTDATNNSVRVSFKPRSLFIFEKHLEGI